MASRRAHTAKAELRLARADLPPFKAASPLRYFAQCSPLVFGTDEEHAVGASRIRRSRI
jgi:hypothetical protein